MKKTEDQAHSLTQLRKLYEEEKKKTEDKDHSLTQLREQYDEENKKTEEIRKIWEKLTMHKKEEE